MIDFPTRFKKSNLNQIKSLSCETKGFHVIEQCQSLLLLRRRITKTKIEKNKIEKK